MLIDDRSTEVTSQPAGREAAVSTPADPAPTISPPRERAGGLRGYLYALLSIVAATIVRVLLARFFGYHHPYVTFYIAVLCSAWYGGLGPGLVATALGAVSALLFVLPIGAPPTLPGESNLVGFEFYFIVTITASILFEAQRRAERRSAQHARLAGERLAQYERELARRKAAEDAVLRAEEQFRVTVEHAPVGIARLALDGSLTEVNPEFCAITGYSREEALHRTFRDLTHPDDLAETEAGYARLRAGQQASFLQQKRYIRKDQTIIWADLTASMVRDHEGKPLYTLAVIQDATTRRRAEEQLREAQKLESIGLLAGGIAHDFNNLLTAIIGNASLAIHATPPHSRMRNMLEAVVTASERAATLTQQLLAYSGKGRFLPSWSELSQLARQAVELARNTAPPGVEFRLDLKRDLPCLLADPSQIQQLVTNLVLNAIEAIGDNQGEVRVRTGVVHVDEGQDTGMEPAVGHITPGGEYIFVAVEDTGSGMDEATARKMFDPFFTTKFTGRGLGLAAVSGIVRAQKGAILVESRPGSGTLVEVLFPVTAERRSLPDPAVLDRAS